MADEMTPGGTRRISSIDAASPVEEWIQYSLDKGWEQGSDPTLFVSYASNDYEWNSRIQFWFETELRAIKCSTTNRPYSLDTYSGSGGTTKGEEYPPHLAAKMWRCRAAIIVVSQHYFQQKHEMCHDKELRFLAWRHRIHHLPMWMLKVDKPTSSTMMVSIPLIRGGDGILDLESLPHDGHPKFNADLAGSHDGTLIDKLPEADQKTRFKGFAEEALTRLDKSNPHPSAKSSLCARPRYKILVG